MFRWALIDIETTGLHLKYDSIIEIAVRVITHLGVETTWSSLVNPHKALSTTITQLTGIDDAMLKNAPDFQEIAPALLTILENCMVVAHNARFDLSFLKRAFKQLDIQFAPANFCSIKLMRLFYPNLKKYNLAYLSQHFNLHVCAFHRAEADVNTLHELITQLFHDFAPQVILDAVKKLSQQAVIPTQLMTDIEQIPTGFGVYLFYGEHGDIPIYIGKSVNLRQRVLSHFQADHRDAKEFKLSQQIKRIETIETLGELSALLLESRLVKEKMPLYNVRLRRTKRLIHFALAYEHQYLTIKMVNSHTKPTTENTYYGAFTSLKEAKSCLMALVQRHQLCSKLCGLEKTKGACFAYQLHRCLGACCENEVAHDYNTRVKHALLNFKQADWPYPGRIAIKEMHHEKNLCQWLIFNNWRLIATRPTLPLPNEIIEEQIIPLNSYDRDGYRILKTYLANPANAQMVVLLDTH